jgi:hypothetical protein
MSDLLQPAPFGALPRKTDTVTAEVLALLLAGQHLTGLDAVVAASTTRLAGHVHRLQTEYGWTIERFERAAPCKDGRVATVTVYHLPAAIVGQSLAVEARVWCTDVQLARAQRRNGATAAVHCAARFNSMLPDVAPGHAMQPGQGGEPHDG